MVLQVSDLLRRAIEETLEDRVAISFSGGLDSTTIATIAKEHAQVELFSAGTPESRDLEYSRKVSSCLGLPLTIVPFDESSTLDTYSKAYSVLKLNLLQLGILVPVYKVAEAAAASGHKTILFGAGAEELFVGYERYYLYMQEGKDLDALLREEFRTLPQREICWIKKVCNRFGLEARFPFHNRNLASEVFSVPLEDRIADRELKKCVLREAAKMLGVPDLAIGRKKHAMQYGSGVHKILMRHSEELNRAYPPDPSYLHLCGIDHV